MVEVIGISGDAFEGPGQLGLFEDIAWRVEVAVALKDAMRVGKLGQPNGI